jgi:superfamily II DNA or RNA helicase
MQLSLFKPISRDERQEECRVKWIKNKCKGTITAATGFGKTYVGLNCIQSVLKVLPEAKIIIIVPTLPLKEQWYNQLDKRDLSFNCEVVVVNTAIKNHYKCDLLVIDECHRMAADTFQQIFTCIKYKFILGLTATFERLDLKHELIQQYSPVIDVITLEEAKFQGWISDYKEYEVVIDVDDIDTYNNYNKLFNKSFEFFGYDFNLAMSCAGESGYIQCAKLRDERCSHGSEEERKEMFKTIKYNSHNFMRTLGARKKFINNHPKKIELARKIINARSNSKIITFSNNISMAEEIGYGVVFSGKDGKKKSKQIISDFSASDSGVLNTIRRADEGMDLPGLSVAIVLGLDSSKTRKTQRVGRVVRKEENKIAEIFTIVINNTVESNWYKNSNTNPDVIVIDEKGLDDVLAGREPKPYVKKLKDFTFRF